MIQRVKQLKNAVVVLLALSLAFGASCRRLKENQMALTLNAGGEVNLRLDGEGSVTVDWGDGSPVTTREFAPFGEERNDKFTHKYPAKSACTITITGENITDLDCDKMGLTALNVSKYTPLKWLNCSDNQLTKIDLRGNSRLEQLMCEKNQLAKIDLSKNTSLIFLKIGKNKLTNLDVSNNKQLRWLYCEYNQLTSLNLGVNQELYEFGLEYNSFSAQALNDLFAKLRDTPAFDTAKIIRVTGNPGANDCNVKIAEDNGWEPIYKEEKEETTDVETEKETITMPDQSYLGTWQSDENAPDILTISEITGDAIVFEVSVYRTGDIYATATIENNEIKFVGNVNRAEELVIKGRLVFNESGVSITIDESEASIISAGRSFDFHIKATG